MTNCRFFDTPRPTRRGILRAALAGAGMMALGPMTRFLPTAAGAPLTLKRLVVINMAGGNDTMNMVVPVNVAPYYTRRAGLAIPASSALALTGPKATSTYMLHPAMPRIAGLWAEGSVAAVQRVGYPNPNLSHFESQDIYSLGVRNGFDALGLAQSGWIARYADRNAPTPLGAVSLGQGRPNDFSGGATGHLMAARLNNFRLRAAGTSGNNVTNAHLLRLQQAKDMLSAYTATGTDEATRNAALQAHDLTSQVQTAIQTFTTTVTYPNSGLGQRMKDIATLIQGGFDTQIFYTGFGGFDTHGNQGQETGMQAGLFTQLDDAVGIFADDMKARGVWNDMAIICITEFGRRNYVNGSAGTDHGHAWCALLAGGAVRGGTYGPDLVDADLTGEFPTYAVDFRSIYKDLIANHFNADPAPIFPEPLAIDQTLGLV